MKIIIDRNTALKAVCEMMNIKYMETLSVSATCSDKVIMMEGHTITFDFEKEE